MKIKVKGEATVFVTTEIEVDDKKLDGLDSEDIKYLAIEAAEDKVRELQCFPNFMGCSYGFDRGQAKLDGSTDIEWMDIEHE